MWHCVEFLPDILPNSTGSDTNGCKNIRFSITIKIFVKNEPKICQTVKGMVRWWNWKEHCKTTIWRNDLISKCFSFYYSNTIWIVKNAVKCLPFKGLKADIKSLQENAYGPVTWNDYDNINTRDYTNNYLYWNCVNNTPLYNKRQWNCHSMFRIPPRIFKPGNNFLKNWTLVIWKCYFIFRNLKKFLGLCLSHALLSNTQLSRTSQELIWLCIWLWRFWSPMIFESDLKDSSRCNYLYF